MDDTEPSRLPTGVRPFHYNLTLEPDLENFEFHGRVEIWVNVLRTTSQITLHAGTLSVQDVHISGTRVPSTNLSRNKEKETMTIYLQNPIPAGVTVALSLSFNGVLNDKLAGFYRSSFKDRNGQLHYLAVTQMEPTSARHVFPCFDEPALKATFAVTLIAANHLVCLSNMDVKSEKEIDQGKKEVSFNTTPPMSTYIVAIVVGELSFIQTDAYHVPVRLYAAAGTEVERLGSFSLDLTARTLAFYDEQFGVPYPLPKMDIVAVPDFVGAMENWGLVIYRERDLLVEASETPILSLQRIVKLVQHELAHQWFGNLVTMEFWDDLWLNEGFATWMAWYACDALYPQWGIWQIYTSENLQHGLALDGMRNSHPVQVPIHSDVEIGEIFDDISYAKGACVLQMIAAALGQEVFLQGIRAYLRKYRFGNAKTEDLWSVLTETSGRDVGELMHAWTRKVGFPVLLVSEDVTSNTIHIRQTRFLMTEELLPGDDETVYPTFLGLRTTAGVNMDAMLTTREGTFPVANLDFFKINANHSGFYRTAYSMERLKKLGEAAIRGFLSVEDRVGLIADASSLAAAGHQRTSSVLSLLAGLSMESEYIVWSQILSSVSAIGAAWMHVPGTQEDLQAFERQLIKTQKDRWIVSGHGRYDLRQLRVLLFGRLALIGDLEARKVAVQLFTRYCAGDRSAIHPDLRMAVFASVLHSGSEAEYNDVLNIYRTTDDSTERITALEALGYACNPALVDRTIAMLLSNEVRLQDIQAPMSALGLHPTGVAALWKWITDNWSTIKERLSSGLVVLPSVIRLCTKGLTTEEQRQQVENFFKEIDTRGFDKVLQQSLDEIKMKIRWVERDSRDLQEWLENHLEEASAAST